MLYMLRVLLLIRAKCIAHDKEMCSVECHCMMHVFCAYALLLLKGIGIRSS